MDDPIGGDLPGGRTATGQWELLHGMVQGANKKYCQDFWYAEPAADGAAAVIAVADGHGSSAHFRSHLGARWAVEALVSCVGPLARRVVEHEQSPGAWSGLFADARWLPRLIHHRWRQRVLLFEANNPCGSAARSELVPYGSTLIGALVTRELVLCWQLGDGDLVLMGSGGGAQCPLDEGGAAGIGDETESLCQPEAWRQMRFHGRPLTGIGPDPLVLLSTDGLSKSYAEHRGFLKFAEDVHAGIGDRAGLDSARSRLTGWLARASAHSGDDTTLVAALTAR